ncbi:unnamed protein product [Mycena citricolor]|uniref:Uncharacterized protein n=1 Tax=Mycena citricolor TaxID=2018698 RepID=A0AAD2H8M3_9AGAR|nr:unnamed protein product [Mycena citricolor]
MFCLLRDVRSRAHLTWPRMLKFETNFENRNPNFRGNTLLRGKGQKQVGESNADGPALNQSVGWDRALRVETWEASPGGIVGKEHLEEDWHGLKGVREAHPGQRTAESARLDRRVCTLNCHNAAIFHHGVMAFVLHSLPDNHLGAPLVR